MVEQHAKLLLEAKPYFKDMKSDNINHGEILDSATPFSEILMGDLVRNNDGDTHITSGCGYNNYSMPIINSLIRKMLVDTDSRNEKFISFKKKYRHIGTSAI